MKRFQLQRGSQARSLLSLVTAVAVLIAPCTVHADYVVSKDIITSVYNKPLFDALGDAVTAGLKSVSQSLLTTLGKSLLASYSPQIADLLFGAGGANEKQFLAVLEELDQIHADLSDRLRAQLDELMDQQDVDVISDFRTASNLLKQWLALTDVLSRTKSVDVVLAAMEHAEEARTAVEAYIESSADPDIMFDRMQLLPIHILAAQLAVNASRYYWGTIAIDVAFQNSPYGSEAGRFTEWVASLTWEDLERIQQMIPAFDVHMQTVYTETLSFYDKWASLGVMADYVDQKFTPPVHQSNVFVENTSFYDNPEYTTSEDSWAVKSTDCGGGGIFELNQRDCSVILDGKRWYYYVDIPAADCLDGWAWLALTDLSSEPWTEIAGEPAASACNRFWIIDPDFKSSTGPDSIAYLNSFDEYSMWFYDIDLMLSSHRTLIHGDIVRSIYGPVSLVLDRFYSELYGGERPPNAWDQLFREYDRLVAMLGTAESWESGVLWENVVDKVDTLARYGQDDLTLGLSDWFEILKVLLESDLDAVRVLRSVRYARSSYDWMYPREGLSSDDVRWSLLGSESLLATYGGFRVRRAPAIVVDRAIGEATAKFLVAAS